MTLGFSLYFDSNKQEPTHFPEKILASMSHDIHIQHLGAFADKFPEYYGPWFTEKPKRHTIRPDKSNRWREGMDIHFVVGNRTKNRYQFAPVVKCTGVQDIFMTYYPSNGLEVSIDGEYNYWRTSGLFENDGFSTPGQFEDWFIPICEKDPNGCFHGKIIHWTDIRY